MAVMAFLHSTLCHSRESWNPGRPHARPSLDARFRGNDTDIPRLLRPPVSGDELIGDVVQVSAYKLRLRADTQHVVAGSLDQRGFPTGRDGAERVPGMAGDKTKLRRSDAEFPFYVGVSLGRRLMMLDAIRAEPPLEEIDNVAMLQLTSLHFQQIVGEGEEPETRVAQLA